MSELMTSELYDLLQTAISNDIINVNDVREQLKMEKRKRILNEHNYRIWEGKNREWYTYLQDPSKKSKIRLLHRKSEKELEQAIIDAYSEKEQEDKKAKTLAELYPLWLLSKSYHSNSSNYMKRIDCDWKKYYYDDPISDMELKNLTKVYLDDWCHRKIKEYGMTRTCFYNMSLILRQGMQYAFDCGFISEDPMKEFRANAKMFTKNRKKEDESQVFMVDEQPLLERECWERYKRIPQYTTPLAILLAFQTGLRFGELVALRLSDIKDNYLSVRRQEITDYFLQPDGKFRYGGTRIVEYTKSLAGTREIYLTLEARKIIGCILESNQKFGYEDEDFLFVYKKKRMVAGTMEKRIYDYCDAAGIRRKSSHKIRKTFISELIDSNININTIRKIVGHEDEKTTYKSYCFERKRSSEIECQLEDALRSKA